MGVVGTFSYIRSQVSPAVKIVAVSKNQGTDSILQLYNVGHRLFGESKVQELMQKYRELPNDIQWHMIGHLQRNKVKYVAPFVALIHSVDSITLLEEIDKQGKKNNRIIDYLFELRIAAEESKYGLSSEQLHAIIASGDYARFSFARPCGLMGIASFTDNREQIRKEFMLLHDSFLALKEKYFSDKPWFSELSMGMSNDYPIALDCGSTMLRLGTIIFGQSDYAK